MIREALVGDFLVHHRFVIRHHEILIMYYYILKFKVGHKELGVDCLDSRKKDK